eukprot:SAG11_NODE_2419_length_3380_cov_3.142030_3_plen_49_part_00
MESLFNENPGQFRCPGIITKGARQPDTQPLIQRAGTHNIRVYTLTHMN